MFMKSNMKQIITFKHILFLILIAQSCLSQTDYDYDYDYGDYYRAKKFLKSRSVVRPKPRVLSWKRGEKGMVITTGREKEKSITVPDCGKANSAIQARIVGGSDATPGQFPWVVLIETKGTPFCVGTILNERWIITAAHCFKEKKSREGLTIRVGTVDNKGGVIYPILKILIHEKYNKDGMENSDIALLKTESVIQGVRSGKINLVNGICLPNQKEELNAKSLLVAGWGRTGENKTPSKTLKFVKLDIMDETECARKFKMPMDGFPNGYNIYQSQICSYTKNKDACQGDSGGPAIEYQSHKAVLLGIVSFGIGCASDFPGVYTKISYFADWIRKSID